MKETKTFQMKPMDTKMALSKQMIRFIRGFVHIFTTRTNPKSSKRKVSGN